MTLGGIQQIGKAWKPLCSGLGSTIDLSGVFCHAAPMVKFAGSKRRPRRCELADLLVVVDVGTSSSFVRRAALVQAKMARAAERIRYQAIHHVCNSISIKIGTNSISKKLSIR